MFKNLLYPLITLFLAGYSSQGTLNPSPSLTPSEERFIALLDYQHVARLAQHLTQEIGNRYTSTFRRDMAVEWIVDELKSYGYEPVIHQFENNRYTNNGCLEIDGKKWIYYGPVYADETAYQFTNSTVTITGVEAVSWMDPNNDLVIPPQTQVMGKAALVTLGSIPSAEAYYNACLTLQSAGAKGVIFQWPQPRPDMNTSYTRIPNSTTLPPVVIPVGATLYEETNPIISSLDNNSVVKLTMETRRDGKNVIATLPSATGSNKSVYITAHFDTTISGPGMNDNASGVIMTLEMARAFRGVAFEYYLVFFLCDAEEAGLRGARSYCMEMTDELRQNFVANYNMDMIATAQDDCMHLFLNINDTTDRNASRLYAIQNTLEPHQRLIESPEALAIAQKRDVFNHAYLAAQKLHFDMGKFNICWDSSTDHWAFVQEATRTGGFFPHMMNATEFDWRYHLSIHFSLRQRCHAPAPLIRGVLVQEQVWT